MQGDSDIIAALNDILTAELTAINQYYVHYKMCENWGYKKLAAHFREESMEEMRHADALIERILYFDAVPNMQRLNPIGVGENVPEQLRLSLDAEKEAVRRLNQSIMLCHEKVDGGTRELLEHMLKEEENAVDWTEAQLGMIEEIGKENYLAEHIHE